MDPITLHTRQEILDAFMARRPFTLDEFQQRAIGHIAEGRNVIVSAPTGAGKTVIAEAAAVLPYTKRINFFTRLPSKHYRIKSIVTSVHDGGKIMLDFLPEISPSMVMLPLSS